MQRSSQNVIQHERHIEACLDEHKIDHGAPGLLAKQASEGLCLEPAQCVEESQESRFRSGPVAKEIGFQIMRLECKDSLQFSDFKKLDELRAQQRAAWGREAATTRVAA